MILYYSCTGNTKWVAQELAKATNERLVSIAELMHNNQPIYLSKNETLGLCFPVHAWRPPIKIRKFIQQLVIDNSQQYYCYALCTAGDTTGESLDIIESDLLKRGITLHATFSLVMPESYVGLPFMDVDTLEREREKKMKAKEQLGLFIESINKREKKKQDLYRGKWPLINSRILGSLFLKFLVSDRPFHITKHKCVQCGICAQVCPTNNIRCGQEEIPQWLHSGDCLTSFSCYHHCPQHAIEFGRQTQKKGQYWYHKNKI